MLTVIYVNYYINPLTRLGDRLPVACRWFGSWPAGLRQRYVGWSTSLPHPSTSVGPERSDTAHSGSVVATASLTLSSVFTGYECRNERIVFKVAVQTYLALHGDAPQYMQQSTRTANILSPHRLRSSVTDSLFVPAVRLSTVGRRTFPVAGASVRNDLPPDVTSSPSLFTFQ